MSDEIIGFVVERIVDLVSDEVNLLRGAKNEFVSLQKELEMMQSFLIDADAKLESGDHRLRTIVKQIREMAYEAEDLIDSFLQKDVDREEKGKVSFLRRMISFCSCLAQTHQMGNEVEELKRRIKETTERLETYQIRTDVEVIRRERPRSYPRSVGDEYVVGFDDEVKNLVEKLIKGDDKILAIVGMGGAGKTTMARKIYNHEKICGRFGSRVWVSVSQIWNEESLLKEILRQTTGRTGENLTVQATIEEIQKFLQEKSCLLVLDDVWEQDVLRRIMVPVAVVHGSKFLITTRIREVIQFPDLGCYVQEPKRLTDEESWVLFQKIAFSRQSNAIMDHESELCVALGKEMLKKCDGLPLAVVSLAGLLSTKNTIHEWKRVERNVSSRIIEEKVGPSEYGRVEDMLELSYSDLNHTLKSCFLYLGLFPEDYNIFVEELMQCWIAENFFKSAANESLEDVAKQHLDELIQRCLVQVVEVDYYEAPEYIRVHDLMRDLAIKKAKQVCFLDTIPSSTWTNEQPSTISGTTTLQPRRLAVIAGNMNDEELGKGSRRLRSLFVRDWRLEKSLKNVFTNYPLLRVLILHSKYPLTAIPNEIGNLIHLRRFYLASVRREIILLPDSIKNLRNLLSLEIWGFLFRQINLKQMKQLRYLSIPSWGFNTVDDDQEPLNLHYLLNLKVLDICGGPWMMTELKHLSPTVEKLSIRCIKKSEQLDMVYQCPSIVEDSLKCLWLNLEDSTEFQVQKLQHCHKLEDLCLNGVIAAPKSSAPLAFPPHVLELALSRSEIEDQDSFVAALVRLTYLKVLRLHDKAYVGTRLSFPQNSLLCLYDLTLFHLQDLEEIYAEQDAMPNLKYLRIISCDKLKVLPRHLQTVADATWLAGVSY